MSAAAPRIINVSPHLLADVLSCDTKAWTRHVRGFTSKGDAMKAAAGSAVHAAIAAYLDPRRESAATAAALADAGSKNLPARDVALATFHASYDALYARLAADQLDAAYTPTNLHRIVDRWIEMHPPAMLPWRRVLSVEEAFVAREFSVLDTVSDQRITVRLIIRPDAVVEDHAGAIRFLDTKTTGWRITDTSWRRALRLSLQFALYVDGARQRYGDRAVLGGWINAMELRQLPGASEAPPRLKKDGTPMKAPACKDHGVPYAECGHEHAKCELVEAMTTEERLAAAVRDAEIGARRFVELLTMAPGDVARLGMQGTANGTCRFCPAADFCESGRYVDALDSMLQYEPWPIEEGHRA